MAYVNVYEKVGNQYETTHQFYVVDPWYLEPGKNREAAQGADLKKQQYKLSDHSLFFEMADSEHQDELCFFTYNKQTE